LGRVRPVAAQPVERTANVAGNLALHFAVGDLALEAQSREKITREILVSESLDHGITPQRDCRWLPPSRAGPVQRRPASSYSFGQVPEGRRGILIDPSGVLWRIAQE